MTSGLGRISRRIALAISVVALAGLEAARAEPAVLANTPEQFQQEVMEASRKATVVVMFIAPWCGPCMKMRPDLEKAAELAKVKLVTVDADQNTEAPPKYGVRSLPMTFVFSAGRPVRNLIGLATAEKIAAFLKSP